MAASMPSAISTTSSDAPAAWDLVHAGYGVASADYRRVGEVLLDVLADEPEVDDATLAAWRAAYTMVAEAMMEGAGSNPFARRPVVR